MMCHYIIGNLVATWTDCRDMCNNTEECEYFKWRVGLLYPVS